MEELKQCYWADATVGDVTPSFILHSWNACCMCTYNITLLSEGTIHNALWRQWLHCNVSLLLSVVFL